MAIDFLAMNEKAIAEFRANDGECGPPFDGTPIVLVTMVGAKSGRELCSPLAYSTDGDDLVIIASYCALDESEVASFKPTIVHVNDKNEVVL